MREREKVRKINKLREIDRELNTERVKEREND